MNPWPVHERADQREPWGRCAAGSLSTEVTFDQAQSGVHAIDTNVFERVRFSVLPICYHARQSNFPTIARAGRMTAENWPDPQVGYHYPARTPENEGRWKEAIRKAQADGSLKLIPISDRNDLYDLVGQCPRCGHDISQSIEFDVIRGTVPINSKFGVFNVQCDCAELHVGRSENRKGCGWGGSIPIPIFIR